MTMMATAASAARYFNTGFLVRPCRAFPSSAQHVRHIIHTHTPIKELHELLSSFGLSEERSQIDAMFKYLDKDKNGVIDFDEYLSIMAEVRRGHPDFPGAPTDDDVRATFEKADLNGDGYLDKRELTALMKKLSGREPSSKDISAMMKEADTNGDGKLSFKEFSVVVKK
jgi:Ca2+-binding EF-hand superfamily protein